jgi:uncharacterized repeat protein (TIGR01451 family)
MERKWEQVPSDDHDQWLFIGRGQDHDAKTTLPIMDAWIDYTIRFQNTGTDTAFTMVITDTLPGMLNPASIQMGAASHPFTWELKGTGILESTFANILLPDSNVNEPASNGFVGFRIRPHLPVLLGEEISNIANIYFDFNPPIITAPSLLLAEFSTGVTSDMAAAASITVSPVPAFDRVLISGIASALTHIEVITADGRMVRTIIPTGHTFDVSPLDRGHYFARIHSIDGWSYVIRFIRA